MILNYSNWLKGFVVGLLNFIRYRFLEYLIIMIFFSNLRVGNVENLGCRLK